MSEAQTNHTHRFPDPSEEEWRELVAKVLKGAPFERLVTTTPDGLTIAPLYPRPEIADPAGLPHRSPFTRGAVTGSGPDGMWDLRTLVDHPDPTEANRVALVDLEAGANSLHLRFDAAFRAGGTPSEGGAVTGVRVRNADDLARVCEGVVFEGAPVRLDAGVGFAEAAEWLSEVWAARGVDPAGVLGCLGADPLGAVAEHGRAVSGIGGSLEALGRLAASTSSAHPRVTSTMVSTLAHVEAGATPAQELAAMLATGHAYLRALTAAGLSPTDALGQMEVELALTADLFTTVSKFRAARRVWHHLAVTWGAEEDLPPVPMGGRTPLRMMTQRDPWVNLLRTTSATVGGALGGAASITVLPFDAALGVPDDLGRRLARNTQLLLGRESHLGVVQDPAGGSGYVEQLTEVLAQAAWGVFQRIEGHGGLAAALTDGWWAGLLAESAGAEQLLVATRRQPITGVSEFPLLGEEPVVRPRVEGSDTPGSEGVEQVSAGLPQVRPSEAFERLRDASDRVLAETGSRPRVFLAALGSLSEHTARLTWARNMFEAGGIEGFEPPEETGDGVSGFADSGCRLAVICSSDAVYSELAEPTARALKAAGAERVYLAGRPADEERDRLTAAGVDGFVHVGCDVLAVCNGAFDVLEIER